MGNQTGNTHTHTQMRKQIVISENTGEFETGSKEREREASENHFESRHRQFKNRNSMNRYKTGPNKSRNFEGI